MDNIFFRIIIGIALIAFVVWNLKSRWKGASDYVEAETAKGRRIKEQLPKFKEDPRYKKVKEFIDAKYKTTFDEPLDEETYKIDVVYCMYQEGNQMEIDGFERENPTFLVFLLQNKKENRSIGMDLATNEITDTKMGKFMYDSSLNSIWKD